MPRHLTPCPDTGHRTTPDTGHRTPASGLSRKANGFVHPGPGQGRLGRRRPGSRPKNHRRLKGCLIIRPNDAPPVMKQAFSLPSIFHLLPQGAALG